MVMVQEGIKPNIYRGKARAEPRFGVYKNDEILDCAPSQGIINHSPDGFSWGYGGSGPAQLALGLLLDVTGDRGIATRFYQDFKWEVVAKWPMTEDWSTDGLTILNWVNKRLAEGA